LNTKVSEIVAYLNKFANPALAYDWDNVGFQIGDGGQNVNKILLSLDVSENAINKAIAENCDMIISHHPFIFRAIKKITNPLYLKLIKNDIAVYCAHTNLDVVKGGVNTILAEKLGLEIKEFISNESGSNLVHVAVYVPKKNADQVAKAVINVGAGKVENYTECFSKTEIISQFKPEESSNPAIGKIGKVEVVEEIKLEFVTESVILDKVLRAMIKAHPYEVPIYALYPQNESRNYGLGLIGKLQKPIKMRDFAQNVKTALKAPYITLWPANESSDNLIQTIAVCGGTGGSLINKLHGRADLFVSADFTYHTIIDSKIPLIDAGHFYTENPVLEVLRKLLGKFDCEVIELNSNEHEISKLEVL
jgi:dinuclear metal center YbgI/SA1388 family protein